MADGPAVNEHTSLHLSLTQPNTKKGTCPIKPKSYPSGIHHKLSAGSHTKDVIWTVARNLHIYREE